MAEQSASDFFNSLEQPQRSVPGSTKPAAPIAAPAASEPSASDYFNSVEKRQQPEKAQPLPGISPENSITDYALAPVHGAVRGLAAAGNMTANYLATTMSPSQIMREMSSPDPRAVQEAAPIANNIQVKEPKDQLEAALQEVGEVFNPANLTMGAPGVVAGVLGGGVTAWRNAASPDTPWKNLALGTLAGFSPVNTTLRVLRAGAEKLGLLAPSNPIFEAAANTGVTARTAAGVGENSLTNATRMLRESPFSGAINKTEEKGKEQLSNAVDQQMSNLGIANLPEEETKAIAGTKLKEELGNIQNPNSGGWVNDTKNNLAGHQLLINNAINPETTNIPISNLFSELRTALSPPAGAESTVSPGTKKLFDSLNYDYLNAGTPPGTMSLAAIQAWKRHIGDLLDTGLFANSDTPSRDLNIMWGKLSDAEKLAYKGTAFEDQFDNLQQGWKEYFNNREYAKKLIDENITPGAAINDLMNQKSADGEKLKRIFELAPGARDEVAAYYLKNMGMGTDGQFNPDRFFKQWSNPRVISPEAKTELFKGPNGDIPKIYDDLALMAQEQARSEASKNPSRTGVVNELFRLTRQFTHLAVAPALGYSAYNYNQTEDVAGSAERGAIAGTAAYAAAMMLGPKLFTNPAFVRLIGTNPPMDKLPITLRAFAAANPSIAPEVTALQNYIEAKQPPKFMGGGVVDFPEQTPTGYAGGGPGAQWQKMSEGYVGGGVAASPFDGNNGNILGYAQGGISHNTDDPRPFYNAQLPRVAGGGGYAGGGLADLFPEKAPLTPVERSLQTQPSYAEGDTIRIFNPARDAAFAAEREASSGPQQDDEMNRQLLMLKDFQRSDPVYPRMMGERDMADWPRASISYDGGSANNNYGSILDKFFGIKDQAGPIIPSLANPNKGTIPLVRPANDRATGGYIEASAMGYAEGGPTDNPDLAVLDMIMPGWRATGLDEDIAGHKMLSPNANDRAGVEALQQERWDTRDDPQRDAEISKLGDDLTNRDITEPKQYAEGGPTVPDIEGMTDSERKFLTLVRQHESMGGQNIMNFVGKKQGISPTTEKGYTAQGYYQMLNSNWRNIAPKLGISAPNAMAASDKDQTKVALALLRESGPGNWINFNPTLKAVVEGRSHRTQEESEPKSILDHFIIQNEEEPQEEQPQEQDNGNLIETINAAPWAAPETKFAAKHILAESA